MCRSRVDKVSGYIVVEETLVAGGTLKPRTDTNYNK